MPTVKAQLQSPLPPTEVLRIITDFGPARSKAWPGVDNEHLTVHDQGERWAEVTEGNATTWERERYDWSADGSTITAVTKDSNVWAEGSRWDYRLTPTNGGTLVDVTLLRHGKNLKGRLIGAILPLAGKSVITKSLAAALKADGS
jgi:hypothetical protein